MIQEMPDILTREALEAEIARLVELCNQGQANEMDYAIRAEKAEADRAQILLERDDYRARWEQAVASIQPAINEATAEAARRLDERDKELCAEEERAAAILLERDEALALLEAVRAALNQNPRTYSWMGHTHTIQQPELDDIEVAGRVRMLYRDQLNHEAVCTLARDRIVHLSERLAEAARIIAPEPEKPRG